MSKSDYEELMIEVVGFGREDIMTESQTGCYINENPTPIECVID